MSADKTPILKVEQLRMYFPAQTTLFGKPLKYVKAVDGIDFEVEDGETFGLVGESGCGKTTAGKCILRIYDPTDGHIYYNGREIAHMSEKEMRTYRRELQLIFQDPYGSLDPRQSVGSIVREAIMADGKSRDRQEVEDRVKELLELVELNPEMADRYPHEMSGGQRQRLGIARALACNPRLVVCDEPVSALDVSIQAQIINLFEKLQDQLKLTYLFIAHDLAVVRHIADKIAVMYLGKIVEIMEAGELYAHPMHPYTRALLSAVPITDYHVEKQRKRVILEGEVPSPINAPTGCPFHPRCPHCTEECKQQVPALTDTGNRHLVACHHIESI
ncbi:MAG: ATP-binding cassette domain-containing protein [Lachnospiraceae bacterium]|nr:ATP-binding cassette domain-containing protein [Lachnospiraceae bacterium]